MSLRRAGDDYYYGGWIFGDASKVGTLPTNLLHAFPFYVPAQIILDRIAVKTTTTANPGVARLGIYDAGTNLYPGSLILDAGTVDVSSSGLKSIAINQTLTPGLKWLVFITDTNGSFRKVKNPWPVLGTKNIDLNKALTGWQISGTTSPLPDPYPAGATKLENVGCPVAVSLA